jgi:uncharacterized protein (DUF4415 family)
MNEKKRTIGSDLAKVDAHEITPEEYEEIPELTEEWFARAQLHIGGVPVKRGRPKAENPKQAVNLRLDPEVVAHFRATGRGWQGRINQALRKVAKLKAKVPGAKTSRGVSK